MCFLGSPDPDRDRFGHCCLFVGEPSRNGVREVGVDAHKLADSVVHGRGGEEDDLGAQVVATLKALGACSAGHTRLQRNPLTDQAGINFCADIDDPPGGLMTDDHRLVHDVVANAPMVVVVHIGTADPNRANLHPPHVRVGVQAWVGPRW